MLNKQHNRPDRQQHPGGKSMKRILTLLAAALITLSLSGIAFADETKKDDAAAKEAKTEKVEKKDKKDTKEKKGEKKKDEKKKDGEKADDAKPAKKPKKEAAGC
jgi:mannitol-specific phosphotransferase system IIBC component